MLPHSVEPTPAPAPAPSTTPADWTPEHQLAHMLDLCEAQMESALQESDKAVDSLIQAFTALAETTRSLGEFAGRLPQELKQTATNGFDQQVDAIQRQMSSAIVAFQFYDKLTQRLGHVRYSLSTLAMFVCDRKQMGQRDQWQRLLTTLRRLYRTEEERKIFLLMADGMSSEEARSNLDAAATPARTDTAGDIELF
jgi:hypothetical protein